MGSFMPVLIIRIVEIMKTFINADIETTCATSFYLYSIDKNECETFYENWGSPYPLLCIYCYELH